MMLFDPSLDAVTGTRNKLGLPQYFEKLTKSTNHHLEETVLQASYKLFLLIADITKLSRISRPLDSGETAKWRTLDSQLSRWSSLTGSSDISLGLLYVAVKILLHKMNPDTASIERTQRVRGYLEEGVRRIPLLNIDPHPPEYLLWPVAILGAVSVVPEDRKVLQDFISSIAARKLGGQAAWVRKRLYRIWRVANPTAGSSEPGLVGLQALLDGM